MQVGTQLVAAFPLQVRAGPIGHIPDIQAAGLIALIDGNLACHLSRRKPNSQSGSVSRGGFRPGKITFSLFFASLRVLRALRVNRRTFRPLFLVDSIESSREDAEVAKEREELQWQLR